MNLCRKTNKSLGVSVEGQYEEIYGRWILRQWRVISVYEGRRTEGKWYRVHGNQRKDVGALKLILNDFPSVDDAI